MDKKETWGKDDTFRIPGNLIPSWRTSFACQKGVEKNIIFRTWGGIGDQICAEPTLRFALNFFKDCEVTLASEVPSIYGHLKFKDVYDMNKERPVWDDYLVFQTNSNADVWNLPYQFYCHNSIQCVDFPALAALRCNLPNDHKNVVLKPEAPAKPLPIADFSNCVAIHAGKHWQSKTFPTWWWDRVLLSVLEEGLTPVLVGKEVDKGQGTVEVNTTGCIDLRNKTDLNGSIWLLQRVPVVICNDSSPLHMAVSGKAFIGFIATAKHPDYITHWRRPPNEDRNVWGWRMKNFGRGNYLDIMNFCPNSQEEKTLDKVDEEVLLSWLPEPEIFGPWAKEKRDEYLSTL